MKTIQYMQTIPVVLTALILPVSAEQLPTPDPWKRFNDWSIGDVLFPSLHLHGVGGFSTGDIGELQNGGHDPRREPFSAQALEPELSLETRSFEGFANYLLFQDADGEWDGELEEAYGKIILIPGGFELKGGQYLASFGLLNEQHTHGWDFVDSETALGRFLGEEGLLLQGGELAWKLPIGLDHSWSAFAKLGFGNAPAHREEHGHGEHAEDEAPHEGENAAPVDDVWTARLTASHRLDDYHQLSAGVSHADGTNGFGRNTMVTGFDVQYLWREKGLQHGGKAFRWRNEVLWRDVDAFSEHDEDGDGIVDETYRGNYAEWGFYTHAIYTWNERFDTGLRLGWVEGIDDFGQDETLRISPVISCWWDEDRRVGLRVQYNYDALSGREDEHSLWLQLSLALGAGCLGH